MYTTKEFQPKNAKSYLTVGDPFDKKQPVDSRHKSKQFITCPPKEGQTAGYFNNIPYMPDAFQDVSSYRLSQPRANRKLGFGSFDAHKRDEFTSSLRSLQYRELLKSEQNFNKKWAEEEKQSSSSSSPNNLKSSQQLMNDISQQRDNELQNDRSKTLFQNNVPELLYDIGKETGSTPICNKCPRNTFFCKHRLASESSDGQGQLRRGPYKTTNQDIGAIKETTIGKPQHGIKSQIKSFYDNSHLGY